MDDEGQWRSCSSVDGGVARVAGGYGFFAGGIGGAASGAR